MPSPALRRARTGATVVSVLSLASGVVAPASALATTWTVQPGVRAVAGAAENSTPLPIGPSKPVAAARPAPPAPQCVRPNQGPVTSPFGPRWGRMHEGLDFGGPMGSPIRAAKAGVVTYAGPMAGYGHLVTVRHADGTETAYGHMYTVNVTVGQQLHAGDVVAPEGSYGRSTGPHLHFEVRRGGAAVNPVPWLAACGIHV